MDLINLLKDFEFIRAVVIYVFLFLISFTFFIFIFRKDKELQKIIGGLSIFAVAIISRNGYVFFTSLFIGGLIVASENFLRSLAAILKSKSSDLPNVLKALIISKPTEKELNIKMGTEEKDLTLSKRFESRRNEVINIIKRSEELVTSYFAQRYGERFESDVKIENEYGSIIFDGVIYDMSGRKNLLRALEVKYILLANKNVVNFSIRRILERQRFLLINFPITIVFVSDNLKLEEAIEIRKNIHIYKNVDVMFFSLKKDNGGEIELLLEG